MKKANDILRIAAGAILLLTALVSLFYFCYIEKNLIADASSYRQSGGNIPVMEEMNYHMQNSIYFFQGAVLAYIGGKLLAAGVKSVKETPAPPKNELNKDEQDEQEQDDLEEQQEDDSE